MTVAFTKMGKLSGWEECLKEGLNVQFWVVYKLYNWKFLNSFPHFIYVSAQKLHP